MFDAFREQRQAALREMAEADDNSVEAQRKRAIKALGDKWLLHPSRRQEKGVYCVRTGRRLK
jgi:hypothetical protein